MSYQLTGKIKAINEVKQISDSFKVREFVITDDSNSQYPQYVKFQVTNDKCDTLSTYAIGNDVTVHFNLRGKESIRDGVTNYWNSLDAWKIEAATAQPNAEQPSVQTSAPSVVPENQTPVNTGQDDDLPF